MTDRDINPNVAYCTYELNALPFSELICDGVSYEAFSGNGIPYVNDARYQDIEDNGPLPLGRYFILDRESGGTFGWLRQPIQDYFAETDRSEWFSLYRNDDKVDDQTTINNIQRGQFRIHPVGPRGVSLGCVTLTSHLAFDELKQTLRNRNGEILKGTSIRYYGILDVVQDEAKKAK